MDADIRKCSGHCAPSKKKDSSSHEGCNASCEDVKRGLPGLDPSSLTHMPPGGPYLKHECSHRHELGKVCTTWRFRNNCSSSAALDDPVFHLSLTTAYMTQLKQGGRVCCFRRYGSVEAFGSTRGSGLLVWDQKQSA